MSNVKIISDREDSAELVRTAVMAELKRLELALNKTDKIISKFEEQHNITSDTFLKDASAEDLHGGDEAYVQWSGELQLRRRIIEDIQKLKSIEYVHN
jgi:hypothetical protein